MMKAQEQCKKELEDLDNLWKNRMSYKYRKPSPRLLQLMRQEEAMAKAGDFDQAEEFRAAIDKISQLEGHAAQLQFERDYKQARAKVVARNEEELKKKHEKVQGERALLVQNYNKEKVGFMNRFKVVEFKRTVSQKQCFRQSMGGRRPVTCPDTLRRKRKVETRGETFLLPPLVLSVLE
jgi:hypothetical protein